MLVGTILVGGSDVLSGGTYRKEPNGGGINGECFDGEQLTSDIGASR